MQREFSLRPILINHQAKPGPASWVKIFTYEPAEEEIVATRGTMYAVLSVGTKTELDFTPIMQLIMESLHKEYFEKTEGGILQALERSLDGIHKKLILMAQQDKRLSSGFSFNLLTAVSWGTALYFGQLGASRVALLRKGVLYDIDEGEQKSTGLYLSSGTIQAEDRIVLATQELLGEVDRLRLSKALQQPEGELAEAVEAELSSNDVLRLKQSGMVLMVDIKEVPTVEEEAVRVVDSDEMGKRGASSVKRKGAKGKGVGVAIVGGVGVVMGWPGRLWRWRVLGGLPALPLLVGLVAVLALIFSLWQGDKTTESSTTGNETSATVAAMNKKLDEAESLIAVNPDRSLDMLEEVDEDLEQALAASPGDGQLVAVEERLSGIEGRLWQRQDLAVTRLTSLEVQPTQPELSVLGGVVYVVDGRQQRLARVDAAGEVSYSVASNRYATTSRLAATDTMLLLVQAGQAFVVSERGDLSTATVLPAGLEAKGVTGFGETGYVLDGSGQVYRLRTAEGEIKAVSRYFNQAPSGVEYAGLAVDGSVYVLELDGGVRVYLNQEAQVMDLERSSWLEAPQAILTKPEADMVLVLQDNKLLRWTKKGAYVGQYQMPNGQPIEMVGVDGRMENVYILSDGAIFKAKL